MEEGGGRGGEGSHLVFALHEFRNLKFESVIQPWHARERSKEFDRLQNFSIKSCLFLEQKIITFGF